jgi:hypothetical protein
MEVGELGRLSETTFQDVEDVWCVAREFAETVVVTFGGLLGG